MNYFVRFAFDFLIRIAYGDYSIFRLHHAFFSKMQAHKIITTRTFPAAALFAVREGRLRRHSTAALYVMNTLAISGSLRSASINSAFCRAAVRVAPTAVTVTAFPELGDLPLFNPDLEANLPASVQNFRAAVAAADALIIASPEYAHGVSGAMKNALDWLVSFEGVVSKPIALVDTTPRAHHAYEALREILQTMSTDIVEQASIAIPLLDLCITDEAMVNSPQVRQTIKGCLEELVNHLAGNVAQGPSFPLA